MSAFYPFMGGGGRPKRTLSAFFYRFLFARASLSIIDKKLPDGATCTGFKFGNQVAPLALLLAWGGAWFDSEFGHQIANVAT